MNYEKKYNEALERARELHGTVFVAAQDLTELIFPELRESEDERIRKLLVWQVYRNIEDETNDLAQSVYDGIKGHDPDLEESIEDWKKCLAYLEKQKEQKPAGWKPQPESLEALMYAIEGKWNMIPPTSYLSRRLEDLYEGLVNTFNVNETLLAELPKTASAEDIEELRELKHKIEASMEQKPAEWSEEDEDMLNCCISSIEEAKENRYAYKETDGDTSYDREIAFLKSLRPSWKPSGEQMGALSWMLENARGNIDFDPLKDLYEQLKKLM